MQPASGAQIELRHGRHRATVVEVGGGLREYEVDRRPVLESYPLAQVADGGHGQPLLPWANRIADGQYEFGGQSLQLPIDEVARHHAIHGLTRWSNWQLEQLAENRVRATLSLHPRPGYPFALQLSIDYALDGAGLSVRTTARNAGPQALPFTAGQHPYLTAGTPTVDTAWLQLRAHGRLEIDPARLLPTGRVLQVAGSDFDFAEPRQIGPLVLDECFSGVARDPDGLARVVLAHPATGRTTVLWLDDGYRYVQVFSGDTLSPDRRRRALAIEPMTSPPNAFRTGTDLIVLQPDQTCTLAWGLSERL